MAENEKKKLEPVSDRISPVYGLFRILAKIIFHTVMPVKCHNREQLDAEAPYVLIANHLHALDPVAMAMFIPRRQICFLGKKELGKNKILVGRGDTDMAAMRNCMKAVKMKKILLIFPEGSRHHEGQMEQIQSGASLIAMRSKAPIIPMYIDRKLSFFKKTNMYVGEPIQYDDLLEKGINAETCEEMNERFRETFRRLMAGAEGTSQKN